MVKLKGKMLSPILQFSSLVLCVCVCAEVCASGAERYTNKSTTKVGANRKCTA